MKLSYNLDDPTINSGHISYLNAPIQNQSNVKYRNSQMDINNQNNFDSPQLIDESFGSANMQPVTKQNSSSNMMSYSNGTMGTSNINHLLNKTFQHQGNMINTAMTTPNGMQNTLRMNQEQQPKFSQNLPLLNQTMYNPKSNLRKATIDETNDTIKLETLYKPNPKGGRVIKPQNVRVGSEYAKEWDQKHPKSIEQQINQFNQTKSKSIGVQRKPAYSTTQNVKTPSFIANPTKTINFAQTQSENQSPKQGDTFSYINFIRQQENPSFQFQEKNFSNKIIPNQANFQRNFNQIYANTQKQNQRRKLLYEFCLAKESKGIDKFPIPLSQSPPEKPISRNIEKYSPVKQKSFLDFIENQNLEHLDVNDSQQLKMVQVQYQYFQKEQQLIEFKSLQNGQTIDQIEKKSSLSIKSPISQNGPISNQTNTQTQFDVDAIFQGGNKNLQQLTDKQKYDLLKQMVNRMNSDSLTIEEKQKELQKQKIHLANLSIEYANKIKQMNAQQDKSTLKQTFRKLVQKAQNVQKANKMLQNADAPVSVQNLPNLISFQEFKKKKVIDQIQTLRHTYQNQIHKVQSEMSFNTRMNFQDSREDETNMASSRGSSTSSQYSLKYHKESNQQSPRNVTITVQNQNQSNLNLNQLQQIKNKKKNLQNQNPKNGTHSNVSSLNPRRRVENLAFGIDDIQKYKRLSINNDLSTFQIQTRNASTKPLTPHRWTNDHTMVNDNTLDNYDYSMIDNSEQIGSLEKVVESNDNEEVDYLKYKNQLKQLKEESKPSYQRGKNVKRKPKESVTSKISDERGNTNSNMNNTSEYSNTLETFEIQRKKQLQKINGNGLGIPITTMNATQDRKSGFGMMEQQSSQPLVQNQKRMTQNTPLRERDTKNQDFFNTRNNLQSDYNQEVLKEATQQQSQSPRDNQYMPGKNMGFKNKNYLRIKKPSSIKNEKEIYQNDKLKGLQSLKQNNDGCDDQNFETGQSEKESVISKKSKIPTVSFTTMTDAVNNAKNGRRDNLPNLNSSRPVYQGIQLADKPNPGNFAIAKKQNKQDFLNMTARGQSHIGFGSSENRGIGGGNLNPGYKDMDSLMTEFNPQTSDGNADAIFGLGNGMTTLNVRKMKLSQHVPTRYEQNKQQFEAVLRQTLQSQIELMKKKKEKIQDMCYTDLVQNQKQISKRFDRTQMHVKNKFSKEDSRQNDYNGIFRQSKYNDRQMDDCVSSGSSNEGNRIIHLVTLDGPNPNQESENYLALQNGINTHKNTIRNDKQKQSTDSDEDEDEDEDDEKKQLQQYIKDRAINNILEPKKLPKYYPPKRLPNPFANEMIEQEKFLKNRKDALAKYSDISKNRYKQDEGAPMKFVIRPGNNSQLINRVITESGRSEPSYDNNSEIIFPGWEQADDQVDSLYNFKWKPTSNGVNYAMISKHGLKQLVNHVRGHHEITTKDRLFINMKAYYEAQKSQSLYDVVPLTIVLDYMNDGVGEQVQMFQGIHKIIDKVKKLGHSLNQDVDLINQRIQKYQNQNCKNVKSIYKITECCHNKQNLWLLKPTGFNRGIGIHIFQTYEQLCEIMSLHYGIGKGAKDKVSIQQPHKNNLIQKQINQEKFESTNFVIQKLIERPLLFKQRKFDIRVWVIVNSFDGKVYMYNESYVRTSSSKYEEYNPNISNEEQIFMQLTNNAIQKHGEEYGKYEEGNIMSTYAMFQYISTLKQANDKTAAALMDEFKASMIQLIQNSIRSVRGKLIQQKYTFELLGYDFILDDLLNTLLIEVNTNPCLEESNKLLRCVLPRMIDDMMNIVSDPIFNQAHLFNCNSPPVSPRKKQQSTGYASKYKLPGKIFGQNHPGYKDSENLFEHICNMND